MARLKILLVDDEPEVNSLMELMLKNRAPDFLIHRAEGAYEALEFMGREDIDCILSDYQMPGMNGLEFLKKLREEGRDTPFIFVTGQGNEEVASEAFRDGANDYFTKEIGFAHFARIINSIGQAVRQRKARRAELKYQKEVLEHSRRLEALTEAARLMNTDLDVPVVLRRLVKAAIDLVDGTSGAAGILLNGEMVFTEYNHKGVITPIHYSFAPGRGVPGLVMQTLSPYVTGDAENDPHVVKEMSDTLGFRSLVDVPILGREGLLLGCFEIHDKRGGAEFDDRDVDLLQGLAASAGVALNNSENLRLIEESQNALAASEARFKGLVEGALFGVFVIQDESIVYFNTRAKEMLGFTREEVSVPGGALLAVHEEDRDRARERMADLMAGEADHLTDTFRLVRKDGSMLFAEVHGLLTEYNGRPAVLGDFMDVTERVNADEARARYRRMLDTILETAQFGIMVVGRDKRIRRINRAALEMMGYDSDGEVVGSVCHDSICPADMGRCPVIDLGQRLDRSVRTMIARNGDRVKIMKSVTMVNLGGEDVLLESFVELKGELKEAA